MAYFDTLGRAVQATEALGADYGDQVQRFSYTEYDAFGRVKYFVPSSLASEDVRAAYAATVYYDFRGRTECTVWGSGPQPNTATPNVTLQILPTCHSYEYRDHALEHSVMGPSELSPGAAAFLARDVTVLTGLGRELKRYRATGSSILTEASYRYDVPGNRTAVYRVVDPDAAAPTVVTWESVFDGAGRALEIHEPGTAPMHNVYDSRGLLVRRSQEDMLDGQPLVLDHLFDFDALGRPTQEETLRRVAGETRREERKILKYDYPCDTSLQDVDDHLHGRLACTLHEDTGEDGGIAAHTSAFYGYNSAGGLERTVMGAPDGTLRESFVELSGQRIEAAGYKLLEDGLGEEKLGYEYDSAGRVRAASLIVDGLPAEVVWSGAYDARGRLDSVVLGNGVREEFEYLPTGMQALRVWKAEGVDWVRERRVLATDALGRTTLEQRTLSDGTVRAATYGYDANAALAHVTVTTGGVASEQEVFDYDAIGNIVRRQDLIEGTYTHHLPDPLDPDRVCHVETSVSASPSSMTACNYGYDLRGNAVVLPGRKLAYDARGEVASIEDGAARVAWARGAEGQVVRRETDGGVLVREEVELGVGLRAVDRAGERVVERTFAVPAGAFLTLIGGSAGTEARVYLHADSGSNVLFTDRVGAVQQELEYRAYGSVTADSGASDDADYRRSQFGRGEALSGFNMVEMGARLYEPRLGRFLQRDPVVRARSASRMNPYAFASNDPKTYRDPTGLDDLSDFDDSLYEVEVFEGGAGEPTWFLATSLVDGSQFWSAAGSNSWEAVSETIELSGTAPVVVDLIVVAPNAGPGMFDDGPGSAPLVVVRAPDIHGPIDPGAVRADVVAHVAGAALREWRPAVLGTVVFVGHQGRSGPTLGASSYAVNSGVDLFVRIAAGAAAIQHRSCGAGRGYTGEAYLQREADASGVPVSGPTGAALNLFTEHDGLMITRRPGQTLIESEVYARQIAELLLTPNTSIIEKSNQDAAFDLMREAERSPLTWVLVVGAIVARADYGEIQGVLNMMSANAANATFANRYFPGVANPWGFRRQ